LPMYCGWGALLQGHPLVREPAQQTYQLHKRCGAISAPQTGILRPTAAITTARRTAQQAPWIVWNANILAD
jgi:hypothetical protein